MKINSKWNCLVALTAVAILSFFGTGTAHAWGPLAQSAIAQVAQGAEGMPPVTTTHSYVLETAMPKVFEYTLQSYATVSYDYSDLMHNRVNNLTEYCQALAWGSAQTAEKTGGSLFFDHITQDAYARWIAELQSEALLFCIESPYYGTARAEVAVMPKLVSDTMGDYTAIFGGAAISGFDIILAAHFQAHVLVGELAIVDNPMFQMNAEKLLPTEKWVTAMDTSVNNVVEYVINSTQAQTTHQGLMGDVSDYGTQLLGQLGSLLVSTSDASVKNLGNNSGVYSYGVGLNSNRVNDITVTFLNNLAQDPNEDPILKQLAGTLHSLMTEGTHGLY